MLASLRNVAVCRNGVQLLRLDRLDIPQGENTVVFGPNGSGKSTFLKLLLRFYYPSVNDSHPGCIELFGKSEWNVWDLRRQLGFVSSEIDHHFNSGRSGKLTPFQAALTGFDSGELEVAPEEITPERIEAVERWLDFFEVDSKSTKQVGWLSTGERRRVLLARAMVLQPKALLLDEPTSGLDLVTRHRLVQRLSKMTEQGIQLLLVTHHLEEIIPQISRVVLLKEGSLFEDSSPELALTTEKLSRLFDADIVVERSANSQIARLR